jgi:DNA invertase Pin-like site-specific DNA recombinase
MILKQEHYNAAIYCRLSTDDGQAGESCSIHTQRTLLRQFCEDNHFHIHDYYVDDGYSGKNFDRPDFKRMLADVEAGKVNLIISKDLSRFGRDYVDAGYYLEKYFPSLNVRYIAVSDSVDTLTDSGDNIFMPLMNVVNGDRKGRQPQNPQRLQQQNQERRVRGFASTLRLYERPGAA